MFSPVLARQLQQSNLRFVITGGGGWIGRMFLDFLARSLGDQLRDRVHVFGRSARLLQVAQNYEIAVEPLEQIVSLPRARYHFFHCAYLTREHADNGVEAYISANRLITDTVLEAAQRVDIEGLFVPSSGAVYRSDRTLWTELEANPYAVLKLEDEARFEALSVKRNFRLLQIRVFNISGPFINKAYALSSIIQNVLRREEIVLNADHPVVRSYVHVEDLVALTCAALQDANMPQLAPFDTAGEVDVEVGELALRAANALGAPQSVIRRPAIKLEPADHYVGDPTILRELAARYNVAMAPLDRQIRDTAEYLKVVMGLS